MDGTVQELQATVVAAGDELDPARGQLGPKLTSQTRVTREQLRERTGVAGLVVHEHDPNAPRLN